MTVIHSADLSLQLKFMVYICILYPLPLNENVIVRSSEKVHLPNSEPRILIKYTKESFRSLIVIYAATNAQLLNAYDSECDLS